MVAEFSRFFMEPLQDSFCGAIQRLVGPTRVIKMDSDSFSRVMQLVFFIDSEERLGLSDFFHIFSQELIEVLDRGFGQDFFLALQFGFSCSPLSIHLKLLLIISPITTLTFFLSSRKPPSSHLFVGRIQQQLMEGELRNLYCNMNLERSLFEPKCNTNSSILFVEGSAEEVNIKIGNLLKVSSLSEYTALRVRVSGRVVKEQNTCCLITTIWASAALLLPLFCMCTQWWRRKALKLLEIGLPTYELIADLLKRNNFQECYLLIEDNFVNKEKIELLAEGLRCRTSNLLFINNARKFDIAGGNSSDFQANVQSILHDVKYAEIRWEKTVFTNSKVAL